MKGEDFYRDLLLTSSERFPPYPEGQFRGQGIVLCAGGLSHLSNAYVCMKFLREFTQLPIELFFAGAEEMPSAVRTALSEEFAPISLRDITTIDFAAICPSLSIKHFCGWQIKPYALLCSSFEEVFYIDADNIPLQPPQELFSTPEFLSAGALFWPDLKTTKSTGETLFRTFGVIQARLKGDVEFESGQILVDKRRCWKALLTVCLANSDREDFRGFCYRHTLGDKDTFRLAFEFTQTPYHKVEHLPLRVGSRFLIAPLPVPGYQIQIPHDIGSFFATGMLQHDLAGIPLFIHKTVCDWSVFHDGHYLRLIEDLDGVIRPSDILMDREGRGYAFLERFKTRHLSEFGPQPLRKVQGVTSSGVRKILDGIQFLKCS